MPALAPARADRDRSRGGDRARRPGNPAGSERLAISRSAGSDSLTSDACGSYRPPARCGPSRDGSSEGRLIMRRVALTLATLGAVLMVGVSAPAQQPAPAPPPAWQQGRPPSMANSPLAPIPAPPAPPPASQIQIDKVKLPPGFQISVWADGILNARTMAWGSQGTLFLGSRVAGNVYAVVDRGGKREVKVIAKGLNQPSGVAFKDGALYVAEIPRLLKFENIEANLDNPPAPKVLYTYPPDAHHNWRYLAFGPDGKLYFNMGAPCNIGIPPATHANISRINPDGSGFEYYAYGVRNSVGFDFHPVTKELYFTNHGRDWMGDDVPNDTLHHAPRPG